MKLRFLDLRLLLAMHAELVAEYGGTLGVRDQGLLESALARPQDLAAYGVPDLLSLAASYAFGVTRNHPFLDGNKRVAFVSMAVFLELNGWSLAASQMDATDAMLRLAASEMSEEELAKWLEKNARQHQKSGRAKM